MTNDHRLPTNVIPRHYRLFIDASELEKFHFHGKVQIDVEIKQSTNEIRLNCVNLNINKIEFVSKDKTSEIIEGTIVIDEDFEQGTIQFPVTLQSGEGQLSLVFDGTIDEQLHGFYRTKDQNQIGACTQFEPGYARHAFPCFDEPCYKAIFTISIRSPKHLVTLSNMPIEFEHDETEETKTYDFYPTPIMSTYLVAFVIGAYDYVETRDRNNVLIRVYTALGKKDRGLFALHTAAKILPFYADYFGIKYPLKKLDMIAIADFGAGAMENWGLITYKETYLLVDTHFTAQETKQEVALIVAHEIAHQWFGNLVTMEWWNDLWLNEGFATWIQFLAVDHVYPEYDTWTQFLSDNLGLCMFSDGFRHSHPIETPIRKASEIDEIFDDITYEKGASVIRFLHAYIGDAAFRLGLTNYLAEYAYKNTITENLWSHLSRASNRDHLSEILSTWTKQMGYPLLTIQQEQRGNDRLLTIEQRRFLADGSIDENSRWKIPINICTTSNPTDIVDQLYLDGKQKEEFLLEKLPETDWIKLNLFNVGIYRVFYPKSMLDDLISPIQDQTLSPQDRYNIQTDVFALARSGQISVVDYLQLLRHAYKHEDNLTVWKSILRQLTELKSIWNFSSIESTKKRFEHFICDFLLPIYSRLEWESMPNEGSQAAMLRSLVLIQLGLNEHNRTYDEAKRRFNKILLNQNDHEINPNVRTAIYLTVAKRGDEKTFEQLKSLYDKADTQEERLRLLIGLCRFDDHQLQSRALELLWNQDKVRKQDHLIAFTSLASHNRYGAEICWEYLKTNWDKIEDIYGEHDTNLIHFIEKVPSLFCSENYVEQVEKFHRNHSNPILDRPLKKVVEQIHLRRRLIENDEKNINDFLRS